MDDDNEKAIFRQEGLLAVSVAAVGGVAMLLIYLDYLRPSTGAGIFLLVAGVIFAYSAQAMKERVERAEEGEGLPEQLTMTLSATVRSRKIMGGFGIVAGTVLLLIGFVLGQGA